MASSLMTTFTCRRGERKEGIGSGEQPQILVVFPLDLIGEVFSSMACCVVETGADAMVDNSDIKQ